MIIGFTGTRQGMTPNQRKAVRQLLAQLRDKVKEAHHGDCLGADEDFHITAISFKFYMVGHPPQDPRWRSFSEFDEIREPKNYLARNMAMVDEIDRLIACPSSYEEEVRSGTWATVRYARKKGTLVTIIRPDGR